MIILLAMMNSLRPLARYERRLLEASVSAEGAAFVGSRKKEARGLAGGVGPKGGASAVS
jgi:hypothetical protein